MTGFVIESATHGVYVGIDWSTTGNSYGPRFSYSIKRNEGIVYPTIEEAYNALEQFQTYEHPYWKRQTWIDKLYILDLATGKIDR